MSDRLAEFDETVRKEKSSKKQVEEESSLTAFGFEAQEPRLMQFDKAIQETVAPTHREKKVRKARPSGRIVNVEGETEL